MSVYFVAQWAVRETNIEACAMALNVIADHVRQANPEILSVRTYRQLWGPQPRRSYIWYEEYASLTALEQGRYTPECDAVWKPIYELAQEGTFFASIWSDPDRTIWSRATKAMRANGASNSGSIASSPSER